MNKLTLSLALVALVLTGFIHSARSISAYQGDPNVTGPNYTPERHASMTAAFENGDYNAWKELMQGKGRVTQLINQNNFAQFTKAHQLAAEGKIYEAQKIRQELGLGQHQGLGKNRGSGFRSCR